MSAAPALEIREWTTRGGGKVFRLPLEAYPGFWVYAFVVVQGDFCALVDCGSGVETANVGLEEGLQALGIAWSRLTHVLITHGHIDHFGGLNFVRQRAPQAQVGVHELDRRNLTNYHERLALVTRRLRRFLLESGVSPQRAEQLLEMYGALKAFFRAERVDFTYEAVGMRVGPVRLLHVPGHCPGHVALRLDDVVLSGDHVLSHITPHQAPESITPYTGLGHYLDSLVRFAAWADDARVVLGSHEDPITDVVARVEAICREHQRRLEQVLAYAEQPATVAEISRRLFGSVKGYHVLLALEETGAHVEYLYQRGLLGVANWEEVATSLDPTPLRYVRLPDANAGAVP